MTGGDAGFDDAARVMAEALRSAAGDGWAAATLQVRSTGSMASCTAWTDVRDHLMVDAPAVFRLMTGMPPPSLEFHLLSTGEYTFTACADVGVLSAGRAVFDPTFRYPGHPLPGMPRPAAAEPIGAPTDPAVLAEVTRVVDEFAESYAGIKGVAPPWEDACTEQQLADAERRIGARLPEDLRALYRVAGADPYETGLLGRYSHDSLDRLVENYLQDSPGSYGWEDELTDEGVVFETVPFGSVKRVSRNDWWVTFGTDYAGNALAVDLDPAEQGRAGQVIEYGRDIHGPLRHVSWSITDMLTEVVRALRAGNYENLEDHRMDVAAGFTRTSVRDSTEVIPCTAATDLSAVVAVVRQPSLVQAVYVNDPLEVDLAVLEPMTSLRKISVNRALAVTASIGGLEKLESLQVSAERIYLTSLAHHPTLWSLQLEGISEPIDPGILSTLSGLRRLNLSRSAVPELERVASLPDLRVLTIDPLQAQHLVDHNGTMPQLAALFVSGKPAAKGHGTTRDRDLRRRTRNHDVRVLRHIALTDSSVRSFALTPPSGLAVRCWMS